MRAATAANALPDARTMYLALSRRDSRYEGVFVTAVKTTGIFCRPTCGAKRPKRENVEFFASASQALHAGYRPCLMCRPLDATRPVPALIEKLRRAVDEAAGGRLTEKDLAALRIEPTTARRQFQRYFGLTFHAYQRARGMGLALHEVTSGRRVGEVQRARGYASPSGFRGAFTRVFGAPPQSASLDECLWARRIDTPLGTMLAIADREALRLLEFVDRRGLENEIARVRRRLGGVAIVPGERPVLDETARQLARYFSGESLAFDLPLAPIGSATQLRVWEELCRIPAGATRSYGDLARQLHIRSARAIGQANGANMLALVIPCHRVIRADGTLCGYGGGLWRKQRLLDHERGATQIGEHTLAD